MVLLTLCAVVASLLVTYLSFLVFHSPFNLIPYIVAVLVPLIVAPLVSFAVVSLLYEVNQAHLGMQKLAITDGLTKAFNRRHFFEVAQIELDRAVRYGTPISLLLIDADNFKAINDAYGHVCGDRVLQNISHSCMENIRQEDVFARYGGEEFILLMPQTHADGAIILAERIRSRIAEQVDFFDGKRILATVSIGVSTITSGTLEQLIEQADQALYQAKRLGKNRVVQGSSFADSNRTG